MIKVSIIIPVYNTSAYLSRCLDSVISQTLLDIQIICINDGSTDNSLDILQKYATTDSRIEVINQQNGGLSVARNVGFAHSTGEFIMFVDSDDYILSDACLRLYEFAHSKNLDVLQGQLCQFDDDNNRKIIERDKAFDDNKIYAGTQWLINRFYATPAQTYFYKRQFFAEKHLFFKPNIYHEDTEFVPRLLSCADRVAGIRYPFYQYYVRSGSITQSKNIKCCFDLIIIGDSTLQFAEQTNDKELQKFLHWYAAFSFASAVQSAVKQNIPVREIFAKVNRKSFSKKLYDNGEFKHKLMAIFLRMRLYKSFSIIYKIFMKK